MANWLLLDFETMSRNADKATVIDMSAIVIDTDKFTSDKPYTLKSVADVKKWKLSVSDQVKKYGSEIETETLHFWQNLGAEVRSKIKPLPSDLTVEAFVEDFHKFLISSPKIDYWWSRSNTFDPIILSRLFSLANKKAHMDEYLKFWRVRDLRTYIDAKLNFPKKNGFVPISNEELWSKVFQEHDSAWDVLADVLRLQTIARVENDLEITEK